MTKAWEIFRIGMLHRLTSRGELLGRGFFLLVLLFIFRELYAAVLPAGGGQAGFDARLTLWYLVVTEAIMVGSPRLQGVVDEEVKSGALGSYLLRPFSYVGYHQWRFLGEAAVSVGSALGCGILLASALVGFPELPWAAWASLPLTMGLALALHFQVAMALSLAAFWIEDAGPLFWVYHKTLFLLGGLLVPLDLYPDWLRAIASELPFAQTLYAPARLLVGFEVPRLAAVVGRQVAWLVVLGLATRFLFRIGARRVVVQGG